ncbi:MAG: hypothetical protein COA58_04110 [Bacteroidetes bacterium]|nr:MAG: hypothetical protein COA58_04110 [Bacteroidota bacterium]
MTLFKKIPNTSKIFGVLVIFLFSWTSSYGQMETKGKEFWGTVNDTWNSPDSVIIFISTQNACTVDIKVFSTGLNTIVNVPANTQYRFAIDRSQVRTTVYQQPVIRSFRITSTADISAYLLVPASATTDATVLYPSKAIPQNSKYLLLTYGTAVQFKNSIVVSHEDNTIIKYTLRDSSGNTALDSIIVDTLQQGECFQVRSSSKHEISGGTVEVLNGKKISAFCGNFCTGAPCAACDMLLEQVPPIGTLGVNFLIVPLKGHTNGYLIQVTTNSDNTAVYRDGTHVITLNQGEVYEYDVNSERAVCIQSSMPVLVSQIMKGIVCNGLGDGDPGLVYISSTEQLIQSALVATANTNIISQHYISLVIPKLGIDSLYIDGVLVPRAKLTASNCGDFYWYTDSLLAGSHSLYNYFGFLAYIYGTGQAESYLYTAGSGLKNLAMEVKFESFPLCDSGRVFLFKPSDSTSSYYKWFWDDGSPPDSGQNVSHSFYQQREYLVRLAYAPNNSGFIDTTYQYVSLGDDEGELNLISKNKLSACTDSSFFELKAFNIPTFSYLWNTGDTTANIEISTPGVYTIIGTDSITNCMAYDTVDVSFYEGVTADFSFPDLLLCGGTDIEMEESVTFNPITDSILHFNWYIDYQFQIDSTSNIWYNASPNNYDIELRVESRNGCRDSITKRVVVSDTPRIDSEIILEDKCLKTNSVSFKNISTTTFGKIDSTFWIFSTNDTVFDVQFTKHFLTSGDKWVDLVVKTEQGCTNFKRYYFTIEPSPGHGMEVIDSIPCINNNLFTFKSSHEDSILSLYLWYWGDGTVTGFSDPTSNSKRYTSTGQYEVELIVAYSSSGCSDTTRTTVSVIDQNPEAKLSQDSFNYCLSKNFIQLADISDVPSGQTYTRRWEYGDTSNITSDSIFNETFDSAGIYHINFIITTSIGCVDTAKKKFTVLPTNHADFEIVESYNCESGNFFTVKNLDPLPDARFRWDKGDGTFTNGLMDSITINYSSSGVYTLLLKTETYLYACTDTFSKTIIVHPNLTANLSLSDTSSCITNNEFTGIDETDYQGSPIKNQWFINNTLLHSDTANIKHHFSTVGNHEIQLIVGHTSSCPDTTQLTSFVADQIDSEIEIDDYEQCLSDNNFLFSILKNSSHDSITSSQWNLDEGNTSKDSDPTVVYLTKGIKNINLYIETDLGCRDTLHAITRVFPQLQPSIVALDTNQCLKGNLFSFSYSPEHEKDSISDIRWDFSDGFFDLDFLPQPLNYITSRSKTIKVKTTSIHGCKDSAILTVEIFDAPIASFVTDTVCYLNESTLTSTSTPSDIIDIYEWSIDNKSFVDNKTLKTVLDAPGQYDAQLIITTQNGCKDTSDQKESVVVMLPPIADFNYEIGEENKGKLPIKFYDASSTDVIYHSWDFSENQTSTVVNPSKVFTQSGVIQILLYVENFAGCSDTAMRSINYIPSISLLVPSAFTPNGDSRNDVFGPRFVERHSDYSLNVYSRWGELLFHSTDVNESWDGTYKGQKCQLGAYIYVIGYSTAQQFKSVKGTVTLLR